MQKKARRDAIFAAAASLFGNKGYAATSMEDIARLAGVSVPTIYAYFPSKADLLVSVYAADRETVAEAKRALIENPPDDPADAIAGFVLQELKTGLDYLDNAVWREVVANAIKSPADYQAGLDHQNKTAFDTPLAALLRVLIARGTIREDTDIAGFVALMSDLSMAVFHQQVAREHDWDWVETRVRQGVAAAVAGLDRLPKTGGI